MNDLARLMAPYVRRLSNLLARGKVLAVNAASKMQTLQLGLLAGERKDGVEHFEPYGFTSCPLPGAEHVTVFMDGDRSHGITIVVADRRYRLIGLQPGEAALHDDQGQKVHLTRNGIEIVTAKRLRMVAKNIEHHATESYSWDVAGFGESYKYTGGTSWEHKTWQIGATVTAVPQSINPPEGP